MNVSGVDDGVGNVEPSVAGPDDTEEEAGALDDVRVGTGTVDDVRVGAGTIDDDAVGDDAVDDDPVDDDAVDDDPVDDEHEVTATTNMPLITAMITPVITHGRCFDARTFTQPPFTRLTEM